MCNIQSTIMGIPVIFEDIREFSEDTYHVTGYAIIPIGNCAEDVREDILRDYPDTTHRLLIAHDVTEPGNDIVYFGMSLAICIKDNAVTEDSMDLLGDMIGDNPAYYDATKTEIDEWLVSEFVTYGGIEMAIIES